MRYTWGSLKTAARVALSCWAVARSWPKGFSITTLDWWPLPVWRPARPLEPRFCRIGLKTEGGVEM